MTDMEARTPLQDSFGGASSITKVFGLTSSGGAAILATYSVSSSTAFMPFIFGRLGFILAPILLGLYFLMCGYLQSLVLEIGAKLPHASNMPQLAESILGPGGRKAYQFFQIANQQLFMPTALYFVVTSLKKLLFPVGDHTRDTSFLSCNIVWLIALVFFALLGSNIQRRFGHAAWLCKATCVLNVLQVALIVARVQMNPGGENPGPATPVRAFPSFDLNSDENSPGYWVDLFTSASLFCYCYVPVFIATEAMQEMENKNDMQRSLWLSTGLMYVLYAVVGLVPVLAWGWQRPDDILSELNNDWIGRTANATLMIASGVDFLITAISLNQRMQETMDPGFDVNDWSPRACWRWFVYSSPPLLITFVMLCFIPKLTSLSGLMTAFVVPFSQILGPAVLSLVASRKGLLERHLRLSERALVFSSILIGIVLLVLGSMATVYSIFWKTQFEGDFFCDQVAG